MTGCPLLNGTARHQGPALLKISHRFWGVRTPLEQPVPAAHVILCSLLRAPRSALCACHLVRRHRSHTWLSRAVRPLGLRVKIWLGLNKWILDRYGNSEPLVLTDGANC